MKNSPMTLMGVVVVFVVSWTSGFQYKPVPCIGIEPEGVICAKPAPIRKEKVFKQKSAAKAFKEVLQELKATDLKMEKRKK